MRDLLDGRLAKYPCPCCGYLVFDQQPGNHHRCPICGWEDDLAQLRFVLMSGSANAVSLETAQRNYAALGAAERRRVGEVRLPVRGEVRDQAWRPVDAAKDNIEEPAAGIDYADSYPTDDPTVLYYWRPTYWRRLVS